MTIRLPRRAPARPCSRLLAGSLLALALQGAWARQADAPLRFEITRFDVSGNTLLSQAEVDAAVRPFTGPGRDFGAVERALEALEARYHAHGYKLVTVQLPEQELNGGVVRLVVTQTRIAQVKVSGNRYFDAANIRRSLPALVPGQSPDLGAVSAQLKAANENPAKKVTLKLQSTDQDDAADALLTVADQSPWSGLLNLDNSGTGGTGRTHVTASLQHANLFGLDHVASLQYTTTAEHPNQVSVWGVGYHIPLYERGDSMDLFANYSNVDSGSVTAGIFNLAVSGRGTVAGLRYNHILPKQGEREASLAYGLDVKAFRNQVLLGTTDFGNEVTVHPLSMAWNVQQPLAAGVGAWSATLVHNLPGGEHGGSAEFAAARAGARASYTLARLAGNLTWVARNEWQVRAIANAQLSADALVPGEQFGAGGAASVRGFAERAMSTDSGLNTNLEAYTPELCRGGRWQCRALGFWDAAYGQRQHALPGEVHSMTISSAGLGLRVALGAHASLQVDWGHVLHGGGLPDTGHNRVHARLSLAL